MKTVPEQISRANSEAQRARNIIYRLFRYRLRSEQEVRSRLHDKDIPTETIDHTIAHFVRLNMINDRVFAKAWVTSRLNKPYGVGRIKQELRLKGIAEGTIADTLLRSLSDYDEDATVEALARKRAKAYRGLDRARRQQRLSGYLSRRGFSVEAVYRVLRKLYAERE